MLRTSSFFELLCNALSWVSMSPLWYMRQNRASYWIFMVDEQREHPSSHPEHTQRKGLYLEKTSPQQPPCYVMWFLKLPHHSASVHKGWYNVSDGVLYCKWIKLSRSPGEKIKHLEMIIKSLSILRSVNLPEWWIRNIIYVRYCSKCAMSFQVGIYVSQWTPVKVLL